MIVGKVVLLRKREQEYISAHICDNKREQDLDEFVYHIEIPLIAKAIETHKAGNSTFEVNSHCYEIISIDLLKKLEEDNIPKNIHISKNAVIHLVTNKSFEGIYFCCPNCNTTNINDIQLIDADIERLSDPNKYFLLLGVLNCKKCRYYYVDKILFNNFLKGCNYDVLVPRQEIDVRDNKIVLSNTWYGAPDSILSRYGYSADGSTPEHVRHQIIGYLISNNRATYYDIQHLLSGFIHGREERNHNAAIIWRSDLEWLHEKYGTNGRVKGFISQF